MGIRDNIREREERERQEVIDLLIAQVKVEAEAIAHHEKMADDINSPAVRMLIHTIQLDSRKHLEICNIVIAVLKGDEVLSQEKEEILEALKKHVELEEGSVDRVNKILKNVWIRESKGLNELIKKMREDERSHTDILKRIVGRSFFRENPFEFGMFKDQQARYERSIGRKK